MLHQRRVDKDIVVWCKERVLVQKFEGLDRAVGAEGQGWVWREEGT